MVTKKNYVVSIEMEYFVTEHTFTLHYTGLDIGRDRIIQISILKLDQNEKPANLFDTYIHPGEDICRIYKTDAYKKHKISPDILSGKPSFKEKANDIIEFLEDVDFVAGHNVLFDWDMLRLEFRILERQENEKTLNDRFLDLPFKLVDTLRTTLHCFPSFKRHNLPFIADKFSIKARKCHTVTYKWTSDNNSEEADEQTEVCVEQKPVALQSHDSVTDVLFMEKILKFCLRKLKININEIPESYPQFLIDKSLIIQAEKLIDKKVSEEEYIQLGELAKKYMNVCFPFKGKLLQDLKKYDLHRVMTDSFMSSDHPSFVDKRNAMIYQSVFYSPPKKKEKHELANLPLSFDNTARRKLEFNKTTEGNLANKNTGDVVSDPLLNSESATTTTEYKRKHPMIEESSKLDGNIASKNGTTNSPASVKSSSYSLPKQIKIDSSTTELPHKENDTGIKCDQNPDVKLDQGKASGVKRRLQFCQELTSQNAEKQGDKMLDQSESCLPLTYSAVSVSSEKVKMLDVPYEPLDNELKEFHSLLSQRWDPLDQLLTQIPDESNHQVLSSRGTEQARKYYSTKGLVEDVNKIL